MKLKWLLCLVVFLGSPMSVVYSQTNCTNDKLIGKWMRADKYIYPTDTLTNENLTILLNDSIKDRAWGWIFDKSGKRTTFTEGKIEPYRLDEKGCKIIYSKRENPSRLQITYILYLDEKYLVVQIPNRHSYTTACFRKK